jgi:hypothetical protein
MVDGGLVMNVVSLPIMVICLSGAMVRNVGPEWIDGKKSGFPNDGDLIPTHAH